MREPWQTLHEVAEYTLELYASPEDRPDPGRADLQLVQDALYAARLAMEGAQGTPGGDRCPEACEAVTALLSALHRVLTGLSGDLRDLVTGAGELAEDLARMRGPVPE